MATLHSSCFSALCQRGKIKGLSGQIRRRQRASTLHVQKHKRRPSLSAGERMARRLIGNDAVHWTRRGGFSITHPSHMTLAGSNKFLLRGWPPWSVHRPLLLSTARAPLCARGLFPGLIPEQSPEVCVYPPVQTALAPSSDLPAFAVFMIATRLRQSGPLFVHFFPHLRGRFRPPWIILLTKVPFFIWKSVHKFCLAEKWLIKWHKGPQKCICIIIVFKKYPAALLFDCKRLFFNLHRISKCHILKSIYILHVWILLQRLHIQQIASCNGMFSSTVQPADAFLCVDIFNNAANVLSGHRPACFTSRDLWHQTVVSSSEDKLASKTADTSVKPLIKLPLPDV